MKLMDLEVLFEDLTIDPYEDEIEEMYRIYKEEVCAIVFKEERIIVNHNRSRHPICRGKDKTFEHIITRKSNHFQKRYFDAERANRIGWIKPIVENAEEPEIKYFEEYNDKKQLQYFFWYEEKDFIIIIRQLPNGRMLITSYFVDNYRRKYFRNKYFKYKDGHK